ncbi:endo alpha-1,4 polygalactosaminidase [Microbacterium sp.]|uniref:endo alpha-1,4 polygalactosaminidase n=1 Tax=Microbacterium sp. TaxID=51671 RepID=UPI003A841C0C
MRIRRGWVTGVIMGGMLAITACTAPPGGAASPDGSGPAPISLPPAGAALDYQLSDAYTPADDVGIVVRDRTDPPDPQRYSICYLNAFQTQPGELDRWPDRLVLRGADRETIRDPDWPDEALVDVRQTDAVAGIVTAWIRSCADAGYDAVEFDNLDSYTRSDGLVSLDDATALAVALVRAAHEAGLAAGQKNVAEHAADLRRTAGFDFVVAEECGAYDECSAYTDAYGAAVLAIEYTDNLPRPFAALCADPAQPPTTTLRDRDLTTPDDPGYTFATCS